MSTAPSSPELRPLALGELIDRSATFWRAHLKPLFLLCFGFELVNYTLGKGVLLLLEGIGTRSGPDLQARTQSDPLGVLGELGVQFFALTGLSVVLIWSYWLATMAVTRYVMGVQLGQPVQPMEGLRRALGRAGALTGAYALSLLWALLVGFVVTLPGFVLSGIGFVLTVQQASGGSLLGMVFVALGVGLGGLGALGAFLWYFLRFSLLAPVLVEESPGALGAFQRSGRLVSGRVEPGFMGLVKMRAMVLLTVMSGILIAVSFVSGMPAWVVRFAYGNPFDPASAAANPVPEAILVPVELFQVVGQSFFTPLALVFSAMFYLDMRMRREGLDLERRLDARAPAAPALAA
ncbi:hypothetical protein P2318_14350 [Myxococcaceae bacterium GXIMD 01537]